MDCNGLRFWMLAERGDWFADGAAGDLYYCRPTGRLQLRSLRTGGAPVEDYAQAVSLRETTPMTLDTFGNYARWDAASGHVVAGGSGQGEIPIVSAASVTDLAMGYDGILYVAANGALIMVDRRERWPNFVLNPTDFNFWRLVALPEGGVMALDRDNSQLGKVAGQPLPPGPAVMPDPGILRTCESNVKPSIVSRSSLPAGEKFVALTRMDGNEIVLVSWAVDSAANLQSFVRLYHEDTGLAAPVQLNDLHFPYSVAWLGGKCLAVLATGLKEALVFDLEDFVEEPATGVTDKVVPTGETYVLADRNLGPFVHGFESTPNYANGNQIVPLLPLSLNSFARSGVTDPAKTRIIDSGSSQTVWHRLFLEAVLPPKCGVIVWLAAADKPADITDPATPWFPHRLGTADPTALVSPLPDETPSAVWQTMACEVSFAQPLLNAPPIEGQQGLFMALIQRAGKVVRSLRGRFLGIRVRLWGDGRATPEIAALRVHASRFSYVDHYLPELYREGLFGPGANAEGPSTRHDFLERFVELFEAQLTRIEDRVGSAYLATRPDSAPGTALDWLGGWIGLDSPDDPPDRKRSRLDAAPRLYKVRGTVGCMRDALDISTKGMCSRGAVILLEDFRLRHTFATILGADLSIREDPLLPGYSASSNSFVGDTLFLGERHKKEFLALFAEEIRTAAEQQQVEKFLDSLAHRLTVFIHDQVEPVDVKLVARVVEREKPAHVLVTIRRATQPFLIGLASLLGINTYLAPTPPRSSVRVNESRIGREDLVTHAPSLDPRLGNGAYAESEVPIARLLAPSGTLPGQTIPLDGSASTASQGRTIKTYRWNLLP